MTLATAATLAFALVAIAGLWAPRGLDAGGAAAVGAVALVSGAGGAMAGSAPTELEALDLLWRAGFGALGAVAGARAAPWAAAVSSGVVAIAAGAGGAPLGLSGAALGSGAALAASGARSPVLGAGGGAVLAQAALRLQGGPHGLTAVVAAVGLGVLVASALARTMPEVRHRWLRAAQLAAGAAVVASAPFVVGALGARGSLLGGARSLEAGLAAARQGRHDAAAETFETAARSMGRARGRLGAWWARPVRGVPILAQHARALEAMAEAGEELGTTAAGAARHVDLDALRLRQAGLDLGAVARLEVPLGRTLAALRGAEARLEPVKSGWLVAPLAERLGQVSGRVSRARRVTATAAAFVEVAPALFGADRPRRYFVAFQTPAELRAAGGIIGNFAELRAEGGRLALTRAGRAEDLNTGGSPASRRLLGPPDYLARYARFTPELIWQNVTFSPDFPSVAQVIEGLYPQSGGAPVDGVISLDPIALAALLELTGPVSVPEWPEPIGAHNAAEVLLRQQYLRLGPGFSNEQRIEFLSSVTTATFAQLTASDLPDPTRLGEVLGPMVRQGRILLHSTEGKQQALFERVGVAGSPPPLRGDYLGVVTQNASGNKIDLFLDRRVEYRASVDPGTGRVKAMARIRLRNRAPAVGLPCLVICGSGPEPTAPGHNRLYLSIYSALELNGARQGGAPLLMESQRELGRNVYSAFLTIPPGGEADVEVFLEGTVAGEDAYRLDVAHQPTIEPDRVAVRVRMRGGGGFGEGHGAVVKPGLTTATFALAEHRSMVLEYRGR